MVTPEKLKKWLRDNKISQAKLAEMLGCSPVTISNFMSGKFRTNRSLLLRMQELMDEEPDELNIYVPPDIEPIIKKWAQAAHVTFDRMVNELLAEVLHVKLDYGEEEEDGTQEAADETDGE